jgi:uncharacterized protein (DUF488 family)
MIPNTRLVTVGHSNHSMSDLVRLLRQAGVTLLADVRSSPFSQRYPQFNRPELRADLLQEEIGYWFLGDLLGGRPRPSDLYDPDGRVDYERVRATAAFRRGIDQLGEAREDHVIALLCAEEDPLDCHRGLMIAPALVERSLAPSHLRGDGSVETTTEMEQRLLVETGVGAGLLDGLFAAMLTEEERGQLLAEAYRARARLKAFRLRPQAVEEDEIGG